MSNAMTSALTNNAKIQEHFYRSETKKSAD